MMTIDLKALKAGRAAARESGVWPGMSHDTADVLIDVTEAALDLRASFSGPASTWLVALRQLGNVLVAVQPWGEGERDRLTEMMRKEAGPPAWTVESHQKHPGGHHLILHHRLTDVRADVTLTPPKAVVVFDGPRQLTQAACLRAHATLLELYAIADTESVVSGQYVLQVAGSRSWEWLRSVFGDAYAGAVL
jgi:hypothetical protein